MRRLLTIPSVLMFTLVLALGAAGHAHAQQSRQDGTAVLPVWNKASGKLEGVLVLEPSDSEIANARVPRRFGMNSLDATFDLQAGDSLALLCDRKDGIAGAIGNLANNCLLAMFSGESHGDMGKRASATAAFNRGRDWLGITFGSGRDSLPAWLSPTSQPNARVDVNDLTVFARKSLLDEAYVSIAGTVAKARLLSPAAAEASGLSLDQWSSKSVELGGGVGNFGVSIVGQVIDTPGQSGWERLGTGLTWRTPWSGRLSVGAENIITRGRNPFSPVGVDEEEGVVPYIRYEQDL